ncbi:MAG TPA: helix-turn-helix domain-containing protein [Terriglobales bacterium]|nr:helix-turn-helix domain-containing protein [Terriglobales bacterium]
MTKVMTVNELANYLRIHRTTLYRLLRRGELPGFRVGSDWRFDLDAIERWRMTAGKNNRRLSASSSGRR